MEAERTEIRIKRDGKWYFGGQEMFRRNILNVLATNLQRLDDGSFIIVLGGDRNPVVVEDVPFYATGIEILDDGSIKLHMHDLQEFALNEKLKIFFKGDIPYVSFRWQSDTRLSRGVYWKLSEYFYFQDDEVYIIPPP